MSRKQFEICVFIFSGFLAGMVFTLVMERTRGPSYSEREICKERTETVEGYKGCVREWDSDE